jgi:hypothetical protein
VVRGGSPRGPRQSAGDFGRESKAKIVSDTERMKNTPIRVCDKTTFVQQKVGALILSITSCLSIIILENSLNYCKEENVDMVSLTNGIMFILIIWMHFWV